MGSRGESSDSKAARERYNELSRQYEQKVADYQKLVNQNTGIQGYQKTLDMANQQAGKMSAGQAQAAANQAIQAGRAAGQSRAAAAMNAMNTTANTYQQAYGQNLNNQQNQAANQLNNQVQGTGNAAEMFNKALSNQKEVMEQQRLADDKNSIGGRISGALGGAASGAQAGGSIGGGWGALAGGVIGGVAGAL